MTFLHFMFVLIVATLMVAAHAQTPLEARLVGGVAVRDRFGDLINYIIFAEERAVVAPPPAFELWQGNRRVTLFDGPENVPPVTPAPLSQRKIRYHFNSMTNETHSMTVSDTLIDPLQRTQTIQVPRYSYLSWYVLSTPLGSGSPRGTRRVRADERSRFTLRDLVFPLAGRYNLLFNVSLFHGGRFMFNRTIVVDRQAQEVRLTTTPTGFNGTAMIPAPTAQLTDWLGNNIRTTTASIALIVVSGPQGNQLLGGREQRTSSEGSVRFAGAAVSLPGEYVFQFEARLSDDSTLRSLPFTVVIERALPQQIVVFRNPTGVAGFQFFDQPIFGIRDARGPTNDPRTNITVTLGLNRPTIRYEGFNPLGVLSGSTTVLPVNHTYTFTDLAIDLPGIFEIVATLSVEGDPFMSVNVGIRIDNAPTFEPPVLQINTIGQMIVRGRRPAADPVFLKLSMDEQCASSISDPVYWRPESIFVEERNITFVPYGSGPEVYVCMQLPTQQQFVPLVRHYLPRSSEAFPRIMTFAITTVSECQPLSPIQAFQYQVVGWRDATEGRRYGCRLSPPVSGTIPPCVCPTVLSCEDYRHPLFTPANLNIGQCVCCIPAVMIVAGLMTGICLVLLLAVIYFFV